MHYKISYLLDQMNSTHFTLEEAEKITNMSEKELLSHLVDFDYSLSKENLTIDAINPLTWTEQFLGTNQLSLELDIIERQSMIYLMMYAEEENASVFHFQDFLRVSRGTILSDIKELRQTLTTHRIQIEYNRSEGYALSGNKNNMIWLAKNMITRMLQSPAGKFALHYAISQKRISFYAELRDLLVVFVEQTDYELVLGRLDEMVYFTIFSEKMLLSSDLPTLLDEEKIREVGLFNQCKLFLLEWLDKDIPDTNVAIYTVCLLTVLQGNVHDSAFDILLQLSAEIIHRMEQHAALQFKGFRDLLFSVFNHLVPAYYRIKYGLDLSNTLSDTIYNEYRALFDMTEKALYPLSVVTKQKIPEAEIAYFTILFGGVLKTENESQSITDKIRAIIVCPNGVSSSLILESELKQLFPSMTFSVGNTTDSLINIPEDNFDVVFSTIPLKGITKKVYIVKPIMSQLRKNQLINEVQKDWLIPGFSFPDASEIIEAMKPYVTLKAGVTEEQLYRILNRRIHRQFNQQDDKLKLADLLTEDNILFREKVFRYEDGIRIAAQSLLEKGAITLEYIEAMIKNVERRGPYIYMGDGIALPHAKSDQIIEPVVLYGKSEKGIDWDSMDGSLAHNIFMILVPEKYQGDLHLKILQMLSRKLVNDDFRKELNQAQNKEEIYDILKTVS